MATLTLWLAATNYPEPTATIEIIEPITKESFLDNITIRNIFNSLELNLTEVGVHWVHDGYTNYGWCVLFETCTYEEFIDVILEELELDV